MREIAVVMITVDRRPGKNYLTETLNNLERSGVWKSKDLHSFHMFDSGADIEIVGTGTTFGSLEWPDIAIGAVPYFHDRPCLVSDRIPDTIRSEGIYIHRAIPPRMANLNSAEALRFGASLGARWILFLEDDIDVCDEFIESVNLWLNENELRVDRHIFVFGANYSQVDEAYAHGRSTWDYGINWFYGTQAIAFRSEDAYDLSCYLKENVFKRNLDGTAYDLVMSDWARATWPQVNHFLASAPSFVQHIGRESIVNPKVKTHTFPSWPGPKWKYEGIERQKERGKNG